MSGGFLGVEGGEKNCGPFEFPVHSCYDQKIMILISSNSVTHYFQKFLVNYRKQLCHSHIFLTSPKFKNHIARQVCLFAVLHTFFTNSRKNSAALLVLTARKQDYATLLLCFLNCLPIRSCIQF